MKNATFSNLSSLYKKGCVADWEIRMHSGWTLQLIADDFVQALMTLPIALHMTPKG